MEVIEIIKKEPEGEMNVEETNENHDNEKAEDI